MERFSELNRYQRSLLLLLLIISAVFAAVYAVTISRVGFDYNGTLFMPRQEDDAAFYEAQIGGQDWVFTVSGGAVTLQSETRSYGPYTLQEDPSAVPPGQNGMTGVIILDDGEPCFRGGMREQNGDIWLVTMENNSVITVTAGQENGTVLYMGGDPADHMKPTPGQIISLLNGPELTHKGRWAGWFLGLFLAALTAVCIFFADEVFYLSICFRVENAVTAEPSDWYLASRSCAWLLLTILTAAVYFIGLHQ